MVSVQSSVLGFPRMGSDRQLKKAVEGFWKGTISGPQLTSITNQLKIDHWLLMKNLGIDVVPVGDFSMYDHILDLALMFNIIPTRFADEFSDKLDKISQSRSGESVYDQLDVYFAMARGIKSSARKNGDSTSSRNKAGEVADGIPSLEMKKWFDTNYHSMVPEISKSTQFKLLNNNILKDIKLAKQNGIESRPTITGPITLIHYCKVEEGNGSESINKWDFYKDLISVYVEFILELESNGVEWVTLEEPVLSLDLNESVKETFKSAYRLLEKELAEARRNGDSSNRKINIILANYFGAYENNLNLVIDLPFDGFHFDLVLGVDDLDSENLIKLSGKTVSLGLIDGRNIWKANTRGLYDFYLSNVSARFRNYGVKDIQISSSCPLLYVPFSTSPEKEHLDEEVYNKLSFAVEKVQEISLLKKAINDYETIGKTDAGLFDNGVAVLNRNHRKGISTDDPSEAIGNSGIKASPYRESEFKVRNEVQRKLLNLPLLPTTTIGSFPQTEQVRIQRQKFRKSQITSQEYDEFIKSKTKECIKWQHDIGLDVLVHGEFERTDMVEFFGNYLTGFTTTKNGWVQSYGSRCVKPPIIYGDVKRKSPMTVEIAKFAQDYANELAGNGNGKPVKGMLTGPVTIIQWSFVRNDIPIGRTAMQIALAIREEVCDLEANGIAVIQVDEPAIREGLPLRKKDQIEYKKWSVTSFKVATAGVKDSTQIHTHMCYSDFNEILEMIIDMDADVLTIENSKSNLKLIKESHESSANAYNAEIGPGVYDVHSPLIPSVSEMRNRIVELLKVYKNQNLWINPDCGLKTRNEAEVDASLKNMVAIARELRQSI
ncbi:putative 5-methyltetrahydropteroyltriglutamate-homocysteine methyltransferase [Smittium culicis]|uniref:5-methyltetrahydropteroyltriglutamate--homocysteine S-methyltransferase n=1 Tax=Smittium culicis TaxID=133412 RepID=A0A1R1X736_9FUNG|nr:putative 5-methyltetrahydropteroyltriglutamate-homocysteine methyltransferase [Smittium culicis]